VTELPAILKDFSPAILAKAIDLNQIEQHSSLGLQPGSNLFQDQDMTWFSSKVRHPIFNGVLEARLDPAKAETIIRDKLRYFQARNKPMMWWTGPVSSPSDLGRLLLRNRFIHAGDQPGMAVDLDTLDQALSRPEGFTTELVRNDDHLKDWLTIVRKGFDLPRFAAEALFDYFTGLGFKENATRRNYLGRLHGKPVASSTLFLGSGVAGIYYVATLPRARRRGVAAVMTLTPCLEAREMSYKIGILQSSQMAVNIYRRLGFKEYCTLGRYVHW